MEGYLLFNSGFGTYLIDEDGRVVHEWVSQMKVFTSKLAENGNLLRDGSEVADAPLFQTGGAAGSVEVVTWENEVIWRYRFEPFHMFLSHHTVDFLPNGNVLALVWKRIVKDEAIEMGRRPEYLPDGEFWDNQVVELEPIPKNKTAKPVWVWSAVDHLIQDYHPKKSNFGSVPNHPELLDVNACPVGGKAGQRNISNRSGKTGEKDWLHVNSLSYDPVRDQILLSFNIMGEIVIIDHSTTTSQAAGHTEGKQGKGGDILYRWGNPMYCQLGSSSDRKLYGQHSPVFIRDTNTPSDGNILLFNNGRVPDREWSTIDEIQLPESSPNSGNYEREEGKYFGPNGFVWSYGSSKGRKDSFYCSHISSCQRLSNGNTLITCGTDGIVFEITPNKQEVWRYIIPLLTTSGGDTVLQTTRQGQQRSGPAKTFQTTKYPRDYPAFKGRSLIPYKYLEA
eukprot:CAMPEP_0201484124 /NCGR_PEP_ID=MMETSP0151_2-20130828/8327_1 /ASSEMBLY_ACC=CAM_ASM_000257 /TAXON_ID=200890 /ORGANISM="Paramoeba atlantica, Strain 621/1 / CCAP 1560/9" /LENGTH=449 /DNA_ID=CAMNT_0047867639 /DNA_START=277 /DNA_END=1626 /DNA_ORIENTATION=-